MASGKIKDINDSLFLRAVRKARRQPTRSAFRVEAVDSPVTSTAICKLGLTPFDVIDSWNR
jgi:hypothetical protein